MFKPSVDQIDITEVVQSGGFNAVMMGLMPLKGKQL